MLGGTHHPLLLLAGTFMRRALGSGDTLWCGDLLHGLDEFGSLVVWHGVCQRGVVRKSREGAV